jgi:hypothetical protein
MRRQNATGICINGVGDFNEQSLSILKKFCNIAETNKKVSAEANWLAQVDCSFSEMVNLDNVLWHTSPNHPIVSLGNKFIDVLSFSDLIDERYIDNFTIDICIGKFLESNNTSTLYLPSEFHTWMEIDDKDFLIEQLRKQTVLVGDIQDLTQILVPVHMIQQEKEKIHR